VFKVDASKAKPADGKTVGGLDGGNRMGVVTALRGGNRGW